MQEYEIKFKDGYFIGEEEVEIYYRQYEKQNAKASIVICHGFCESSEKYIELINDFNDNNFNVYIFDHRGHGKSSRLGSDSSQIYVQNFNDYVKDLKTFIDSVVMPNASDKKIFLYAHSMGGCIGTLFLEQYPNYFDGAILNAPMLEINTGNYPRLVTKIISNIACLVGANKSYIIGHDEFQEQPNLELSGTSCEKRYMTYFKKQLKNKDLQTGGASYQWLKESLKATKRAVEYENSKKIKIPVLIFQAGKDTFVKPGGQDKLCSYVQNGKLIKLPNAKHEIYIEQNHIRDEYIKHVIAFYNANINIKNIYNI